MNTTYGGLQEKLQANGYVPTSATHPGLHGYKAADHAAAVMCLPYQGSPCGVPNATARNVLTLTVTVRDKALRAKVVGLLAKHGIGKGPSRIDSAGNETFVLRWDSYHNAPISRESAHALNETDPAVCLGGWMKVSTTGDTESTLIPLSGTWQNGDLLSVPREALPEIDSAALDEIFSAVDALVEPPYVYKAPPLPSAVQEKIKRGKVERERLDAQLATRKDEAVWREVSHRLNRAASFGFSGWEKAAARERAERPETRIAEYDVVVAERAEAERLKRPHAVY